MTNTSVKEQRIAILAQLLSRARNTKNFMRNIWKNADIKMSIIRLWFIAWVSTETQEKM